jgi:magnesium chelatase family protein
VQHERFFGRRGVYKNADMQSSDIENHCGLSAKGSELLQHAIQRLKLSARAYDRIRKMARTIADLSLCDRIEVEHIAEAVQYRSLDRPYWHK